MGKASTYSDVSESPQTRCTECKTIFEVSAEHLSSSDTRVRCGECFNIFDALANLRTADDTLDTSSALSDATSGDGTLSDTALDLSGALSPYDDETYGPALSDALDPSALDVTYTDFDLFSADAALPEVNYLDQRSEPPDLDFDSVDIDHDETFSDTLFAQDQTIDTGPLDPDATASDGFVARVATEDMDLEDPDFLFDDATVEPIDFNYHDATLGGMGLDETLDPSLRPESVPATVLDAADGDIDRANEPVADDMLADVAEGGSSDATAVADGVPAEDVGSDATGLSPASEIAQSPGLMVRVLIPALLVLLLIALAAGLYLIRHRDTLHNNASARGFLVPLCSMVGCTVPSRVDLESLRMLERDVSSHATLPNALVIKVAFVNEASFAQRYPVLVARLRDRVGRLVAERDFQPADYRENWQPGDTIDADERLDIVLEVSDPGDNAESIVFEFHEAVE